MGSGVSNNYSVSSLKNKILFVTIFKDGKMIYEEEKRRVIIDEEKKILIQLLDSQTIILDIKIDIKLEIIIEKQKSNCSISIRDNEYTILLLFELEEETLQWYHYIHDEIIIMRSKQLQGTTRGLDMLLNMIDTIKEEDEDENENKENKNNFTRQIQESKVKVMEMHDTIQPPRMKIVILVVGTRGDVQPFVNLGLELKSRGHLVRVATHSEYRQDVVKEGLDYYPLAGFISFSLSLFRSLFD